MTGPENPGSSPQSLPIRHTQNARSFFLVVRNIFYHENHRSRHEGCHFIDANRVKFHWYQASTPSPFISNAMNHHQFPHKSFPSQIIKLSCSSLPPISKPAHFSARTLASSPHETDCLRCIASQLRLLIIRLHIHHTPRQNGWNLRCLSILLLPVLPQHSQKFPHSKSERSGVGRRGGIGAGGGTRLFLELLVHEDVDDDLVVPG